MYRYAVPIVLALLPIPALCATVDLNDVSRTDRAILIVLPEEEKHNAPMRQNPEDCGNERWLTRAGQAMASELADTLRKNGFGKSAVYSSQSCAAVEAAKLMNLKYKGSLNFLNDVTSSLINRTKNKENLAFFLADKQGEDTLIFMTHKSNITDLSGLYLDYGEAISITVNLAKFESVFEYQVRMK